MSVLHNVALYYIGRKCCNVWYYLFFNHFVLDTVPLQLLVGREFILFLSYALFFVLCVYVCVCVHGLLSKHLSFLKHSSFPLGNYQLPIVHGFREKIITDNGFALGKLRKPDPLSQYPSTARGEYMT